MVEVDETDDGATVTSGDTSATLRALRPDEWPTLPEPDGASTTLDAAALDLIAKARAENVVGRGSYGEAYPLFGFAAHDNDALYVEN